MKLTSTYRTHRLWLTSKYFEDVWRGFVVGASSTFCILPLCAQAKPAPSVSKPRSSVYSIKESIRKNLFTGTYNGLETSFELPDLKSDPFDYLATDVRVKAVWPDGEVVSLLAFFDGSTTWRVRYTPNRDGIPRFDGVTLNGEVVPTRIAHPVGIQSPIPHSGAAVSFAAPGFVRINKAAPKYFGFDNGRRFFPIGHNQAWKDSALPDIPVLFGKMNAAGENWSRVWMNHWDGKNLDWPLPGKLGDLNLEVARRWDSIVQAADRNGIYFQMTLQHHGQYSTTTNPNWDDNPYNLKNGGFLPTPDEFFTSERARSLTKRKLRYAVARWGYSPHILAWELWNEVQFTDAAKNKKWDDIAAWHREMATFLRAQDPYHHLITTSSSGDLPSSVWQSMDFYQEHSYPSDVIVAMSHAAPTGLPDTKPYFVGEFGPSDLADNEGIYLHAGLWASLLSGAGGAAQYWTWDVVEKNNLYPHFQGASRFLNASRLDVRDHLRPLQPLMSSAARSELSFGPGAGWGQTTQSEFTITSSGPPPGISALPKYFQGQNHRDLNPQPLRFRVDYPQAGQFIVQVEQAAKAGAHLKIGVDHQTIERDFPAAEPDTKLTGVAATVTVAVPKGAHTITLENSGQDWLVINRFTFTNYAPALAAHALSAPNFYAAWIYHRANIQAERGAEAASVAGTLPLSGLQRGRYRAVWMDTISSQILKSTFISVRDARPIALETPPIRRDVALYVTPQETPDASRPRRPISHAPAFILRPR